MDLNKGLPDYINLAHKDLKWSQSLDFENTAFRCRVCHQTGHLQSSCTLSRKKTTKNLQKKKGWNFPDMSLSDEEEEETEVNQRQTKTENQQENQTNSQEKEAGKMEEKKEINEKTSSPTDADPQQDEQISDRGVIGTKRAHVSESSDLEKDVQLSSSLELAIIHFASSLDGWKNVQKKKGKKDKSSVAGIV